MNIVITGGSRGMGKAIAEKLHSEHTCILIARPSPELEETARALGCPAFPCDVADVKQVETTFAAIEKQHGPVDILINGAGIWIEGALDKNTYEAIDQAVRINILGTMYPCKAVLSSMRARKQGLIINISSQAGFKNKGERSVYQATKWAIRGFSLSLLDEVHDDGVRVTNFAPGTTNTEFFTRAGAKNRDVKLSLSVEEVANTVAWIIAQPASVAIPEIGIKNTWQ